MVYTATVTQKGQVTIPADIRKLLGVKPYDKVAFQALTDHIVITPAPPDFLSLKGSVKTKKAYSDRNADEKIREFMAKEYAGK